MTTKSDQSPASSLRFKPGDQVICVKVKHVDGRDFSKDYKSWIGTVCIITSCNSDSEKTGTGVSYDYTIVSKDKTKLDEFRSVRVFDKYLIDAKQGDVEQLFQTLNV